METPAHRIHRWVAALDDLTGQESLLLRSGETEALLAVQRRIAPLIEVLVTHASDADDASRRRLAAIIARRRSGETWLADALGRGRAELSRVANDRRRLVRMRPAYAGAETPEHRFTAVG